MSLRGTWSWWSMLCASCEVVVLSFIVEEEDAIDVTVKRSMIVDLGKDQSEGRFR